jgi:hypothetical protein
MDDWIWNQTQTRMPAVTRAISSQPKPLAAAAKGKATATHAAPTRKAPRRNDSTAVK